MTIYISFFFVLISIFSKEALSKDYKIISATDNCSAYLRLEDKLKCSSQKEHSSEYLAIYGYKYCSRFLQVRDAWPNKLKTWAESTTRCLQDMLINNNERIKPCDQLESFAFDSHPICYKQYGYCDFTIDELRIIIKVLDETDVYKKFRKSFSQWINIAITCPNKNIIDEAFVYFKIIFEYFSYNFPNPSQKTLNYIINLLSEDTENSKKYFLNLSLAIAKNDPSFQANASASLTGQSTGSFPRDIRNQNIPSIFGSPVTGWAISGYPATSPNSGLFPDDPWLKYQGSVLGSQNSTQKEYLRDVDYNDELLKRIKIDLIKLK